MQNKPLPSPLLFTRQANGRLVHPDADPIADAHRGEMREKILELLQSLPEQQRHVITLRLGLEDGIPRTLREVGLIQGYSQENVRRYEMEGLRRLKSPLSRQQLTPFALEPGSSEILEKLRVDLSFVGLSPQQQRDWEILLSQRESFLYLASSLYDDQLLSLGSLPLTSPSNDSHSLRLIRLPPEVGIFFHQLYRSNHFRPLTFDLSEASDDSIQHPELIKSREKGRFIFERILEDLFHGHLERSIQALLPSGYEARHFYWVIDALRKKRKTRPCISPWYRFDPRFKQFLEVLKPFGIKAFIKGDEPQGRELCFTDQGL